jgi:hypothetical protein
MLISWELIRNVLVLVHLIAIAWAVATFTFIGVVHTFGGN